jgi:hypothetical protein
MLLFLACIPSGGALLAKVYGVAQMQPVTLYVFLPCLLFILAVWIWAGGNERRALSQGISVGILGGLLGTFAYDLVRVPFLMAGQRVFAPITAYGVWIADATLSSRFTDVTGWVYHFSNGITFGIMYALFMRKRHWIWAIIWAFLLETIAVVSPFATIFSLKGNYGALGIAYLGHVAYGLPLGWLVAKWDMTVDWLSSTPGFLKVLAVLVSIAAITGPLISKEEVDKDGRAVAGEFRVEGRQLNPDWLRIDLDEQIGVTNPDTGPVTVVNKDSGQSVELKAQESAQFDFGETGIYQIYVETERRTRSSFVIVEPVEDTGS